jgi:hypothetical protein
MDEWFGINEALSELVKEGTVQMGVNEDGEFIFWLTPKQEGTTDGGSVTMNE